MALRAPRASKLAACGRRRPCPSLPFRLNGAADTATPSQDLSLLRESRDLRLRQRTRDRALPLRRRREGPRLAERAAVPRRRRGRDDHAGPGRHHGGVHRLPRRRGRGGDGRGPRRVPAVWVFVVLPAPYVRRLAARPAIAAFVLGVTAAATGALAGAAVVIARGAIRDFPTALIAVAALLTVWKTKVARAARRRGCRRVRPVTVSGVRRGRIPTGLLAAALFVASGPARAQGGPPLVTDDPGTPGAGKWEVNVAFTMDRTSDSGLYGAPLVDMNYGGVRACSSSWRSRCRSRRTPPARAAASAIRSSA